MAVITTRSRAMNPLLHQRVGGNNLIKFNPCTLHFNFYKILIKVLWRVGNPIKASNGLVTAIEWETLQRRTIKKKINYRAEIIAAMREYLRLNSLTFLSMGDGADIATRWLQFNSREM